MVRVVDCKGNVKVCTMFTNCEGDGLFVTWESHSVLIEAVCSRGGTTSLSNLSTVKYGILALCKPGES